MSMKKGLTILAGAVALAVSAGASASTTTTIILNVVDTTNGNSFVFDTSIPTSATDPGVQSFNLAGNTAYQSFLSGETSSSDVLLYSVVGTNGSTTAPTIDTTSSKALTSTSSNGQNVLQGATLITQFLTAVNNPNGGALYLPAATTPAAAQWATDTDPGFITDIGVTDLNAVGTAENFYELTATNTGSTRGGFTYATLSSQWNFTSAGLLTYGSSAVPLPAPVVLLLSGLGLMGVVARRRQAAAA